MAVAAMLLPRHSRYSRYCRQTFPDKPSRSAAASSAAAAAFRLLTLSSSANIPHNQQHRVGQKFPAHQQSSQIRIIHYTSPLYRPTPNRYFIFQKNSKKSIKLQEKFFIYFIILYKIKTASPIQPFLHIIQQKSHTKKAGKFLHRFLRPALKGQFIC